MSEEKEIALKRILREVENALSSKYGQGRFIFEYIGATKNKGEVMERYNIHAWFDSLGVSHPVLTLTYQKRFLGRKRLVDFVVYPPDEIVRDMEIALEAMKTKAGKTGDLFVDVRLLEDLRRLKELLDRFFSKYSEEVG